MQGSCIGTRGRQVSACLARHSTADLCNAVSECCLRLQAACSTVCERQGLQRLPCKRQPQASSRQAALIACSAAGS